MRTFLGIILGVLLTVGFAYLHDSSRTTAAPGEQTSVERPMVNWDVASANWNRWTRGMQETFNTAWKKLETTKL